MSTFRPTFVSHAHVDNDLCDRYVAALHARGIDTWYDRNDAQAGNFLGTDIQRELQQRTAFVLLMTQQALDSFWVQLELQAYLGLMAQDRSRILLPVRIGPCQVPPFLNALFWIDAQAMPFDQAIDAVAKAVATTPSSASRDVLPVFGPAPAPANSTPAMHLTTTRLDNLGYRGYNVGGVECILPPVCPVPAGVFMMGRESSYDREPYDDDMPQCPVGVATFAIGQHPVTVAEYGCAVRVGAVSTPAPTPYVQELLRGSEFQAAWAQFSSSYGIDWQTQRERMDHPVVGITWTDAVAYAAWLTNLTGQTWRLPAEAEWEKAARGTDERIYPWGYAFDKSLCNSDESGIGTTTSVGSYPTGESPYHVQDMAGNVQEWTSMIDKLNPYWQIDGRPSLDPSMHRVLRGGCYGSGAKYVRTDERQIEYGGVLSRSVGFRLVWAPGPT